MMEQVYAVSEMGVWEFWGTLSECIDYVSNNMARDSFFNIVEV